MTDSERLVRIETLLETYLVRLTDHEGRIRSLETEVVTKKAVMSITTVTATVVTLLILSAGFFITISERLWT